MTSLFITITKITRQEALVHHDSLHEVINYGKGNNLRFVENEELLGYALPCFTVKKCDGESLSETQLSQLRQIGYTEHGLEWYGIGRVHSIVMPQRDEKGNILCRSGPGV